MIWFGFLIGMTGWFENYMNRVYKYIKASFARNKSFDEILIMDEDTNNISPCIYNIILILRFHPEWKDVIDIEFNDPEKEVIVIKKTDPPLATGFIGKWLFSDSITTAAWLQKEYSLMVTPKQVNQAVKVVGLTNCQYEANLNEKNVVVI